VRRWSPAQTAIQREHQQWQKQTGAVNAESDHLAPIAFHSGVRKQQRTARQRCGHTQPMADAV